MQVISSPQNGLHEPFTKPTFADIAVTVGLVLLQIVTGLVGYIFVVLEATHIAACSPSQTCDLPLYYGSWYLIPAAVVCAVVFTLVGSIVLGRREANIRWAGAIGEGMVLVIVIVAAILNWWSTN